jgi:hypothetical protein
MITAAVCAASACYSMKTVTLDDLSATKSGRVWVTHHDESQTVVHDAQVFRGNLVGFVDGKYRELEPAQVRNVRVRRLASGKTAALIGAGALGLTITAVLFAGSEKHFDPCIGNDDEECV